MLRALLTSLLLGLVVTALIVAGAGLWGYGQYRRPGPAAVEVTVVLERGASVQRIAGRLAEAGVIDNPDVFTIAVRLTGRRRGLQAGEYRFRPRDSMASVVARLRAGDTVVRRLTVPEGLTTAEVLALVGAAEGLVGELGPVPPEGALLPETYHYGYGDRRAGLIDRMRVAMREALIEIWAQRLPELPLATPEEAAVLASLVEKETAVASERARIASVFTNRLRRDMRLQSDPTVVFALTRGRERLERPLIKADLEVDSPYNTYLVKGLPPAPIANPGRAALLAAVRPLDTDELYFVADGSGGHAFARTFKEHQANVRHWRRVQAEQRKTE
jgi:UPF0755 protein